MFNQFVRVVRNSSLVLTGVLGMSAAATAQAASAVPMVTRQVDNAARVTLPGTIHRQAQARFDRGAVEGSFQAPRVQLMLKRPPEREAALRQFLSDVHTKGSASYHKWLTPEQFGKQFGPADSDVQAVTGWMQSQGLSVTKVSRGRTIVEFGGSAAQIEAAFGTSIHKYVIGGETHYANASAVKIPQALAPAVAGIVSLSNFKLKPQSVVLGHGTYSPRTHKGTGDWNLTNEGVFYVAPGDFGVQYDTAPLLAAGTNGKGVTIGIINDSNIDISLTNAYRSLFSLSANTPQVVIDGNDPGITGDSIEAYLDVEEAGAVAPSATINLYIAADTSLVAGLDLATARAVDDDAAQILNLSFGGCESLLSTENAFYASMWQQAAAQGQTVMVSAGDTGSEGCYSDTNPIYGLAVNGSASTPYNVAVGGTDFYYSDYASTAANSAPASFGTYWLNYETQSNTPATSIAKYIPEQPWNNSQYGFNIAVVNTFNTASTTPVGGGGGLSSCSTQDSSGNCLNGYAKPSYQSSLTPADSARDIPDVSLFAANGYNLSAYPICAYPGDCNTDGQTVDTSQGPEVVTGVGGTSVASPAFAGIMAMVVQKYGAQGQANYTLYPLNKQFPAAFHDVTVGTNNEPCDPNATLLSACTADVSGNDSVGKYSAVAGYDTASGLGSVDANVLVTDWPNIVFTRTATTLTASPSSITHGSPVTLTANVTQGATGDVAFVTTAALPGNKGLGFATLTNGAATVTAPSTTVADLPGGTYSITAQYAGDGTFAPSASAAQTVTVTAEASTAYMTLYDWYLGTTLAAGSQIPYGTAIAPEVQPVGASVKQTAGATVGSLTGDGVATGSTTFTDGSTNVTIPMNAAGIAEWNPGTFSVGAHSVTAKYSGDASFQASTAAALAFTVVKGTPIVNVLPLLTTQQVGAGLAVQVLLCNSETTRSGTGCGSGGGSAPTGTVTVTLGTQTQTGTLVAITAANGLVGNGNYSTATVNFTTVPAGATAVSAAYSGDSNWTTATGTASFASAAGTLAASTTTLTVTPATGTNNASSLTFTAVVSGTTSAPTGTVQIYYGAGTSNQFSLQLSSGVVNGNAVTVTTTSQGTGVYGATDQFVAVYSGDTTYAASSSFEVSATVDQSDFNMVTTTPVVVVGAGATGTGSISLNSVAGFNGTVALTCVSPTAAATCAVTPASVALNGHATATVTITPTPSASTHDPLKNFWYAGGGIALGCILFFGIPARQRGWRSMLGLLLFAVLTANIGCGGGGGSSIAPTETQTAMPTFSPVAGTFATAQSVTIADATAGAVIYYTTDGTTPTTASPKFGKAIAVSSTETINALALASGDTASDVASATYTISTTKPPVSTGTNPVIHNVAIQVVTPTGASTIIVSGTVAQ